MSASPTFVQIVSAFAHAHELWARGDRILAAVSGGPDSMALLLALHELAGVEGFSLYCAVVNHHLREEAEEEAGFVRQAAERLGIPCKILDVDVPSYRNVHGGSVETAARTLRYEALRKAAKTWGCRFIALAHHKDDQAETVLMHLLRGSGLKGLTGMQPRRDDCIRPLLCVSKADILQFLIAKGQSYCHDPTNDIPDTTRNRIRLELLPALTRYNPKIRDALCRTAESLSDDEAFLEAAAIPYTKAIQMEKDMAAFPLADFLSFPLAIQRRLLRRIWQALGASVLSWEDIERLLDFLAKGKTGQKMSAAGAVVLISYGRACIKKGSTRAGTDFFLEKKSTWTLAMETSPLCPEQVNANQLVLDADQVGCISLRTRREGDRFAPPGMEGTKAVSKYMKELQIPAPLRDSWPLAADENHIYWIGGRAKSRYGKPTIQTKNFLILTLRRT